MKNEAAFIPDNISNISNASQPFHNHFPHESTEFHSDSTDNLVEEILRQRAERLKKEKNINENMLSSAKIEESEKEWKDEQEIEEKEGEQIGKQPSAQPAKQPKDEFQLGGRLNNHSNGTINHSSFKKKQQQSPNNKIKEDIEHVNNQANKLTHSLIEGGNHKNHQSGSNKSLLNNIDKINDESVRRSVQQEVSQGEKSMQLNLSLSPSDKKYDKNNDNSSLREKASSNSSKRNNKIQLEMNNLQQSNHTQEEDKKAQQPEHSHINQESSNNLIHQQIGGNQSKIEAKSSILHEPQSLYAENKGFYDFTPLPQKNETDRELVKALTQHLQTIDKIDNEEFTNQKTFRKSEKFQPPQPQANLSKNQFLDIKKELHFEQFQTDYSENQRENKILQHRFESNLQYEIGQLKEMIELYEALIANQECKQLRKDIKDLQIRNRREKIALRAASYTKIFNFHSPIAKNNSRPIEFRTKFVISDRLAGKYHETMKKIAEEKKLHVQLEDKYQVLNDYYDMMKQRKIQVYQESLKEYEYNSKIEKYETVKNSFFTPIKESNKHKSEYEFNKTKRTIEMENAQVPYFQVLKYKIDINKDMILQFEVWNLSKLKKLRDSNNLIRKEIQYVDQQISEIDNKFLKIFGIRKVKSSSKDIFSSPSSRYHIESPMKSISKSPQARLRRPQTIFSSPQKLSKTNSFKDYDTPINKTSFKRQEQKEQLLLIDSVQLDFSKRKAMRIFEQMDDYGISPIIQESKVIEDNPTLIKKQSKKKLIAVPKPQSRSKSKNLVRTRSKQIKTETSLNGRGALNGKSGKMSEQVSPQKTVQSEYYTSMQELYPKGK